MSLFNSIENIILNSLFGSGTPATYQLGVCYSQPSEDGSVILEPSGNGYARVSITNNVTSFPAAVLGVKLNGVDFQFPQATVSWGASLTHWVLFDGATPVMWGTLSPAKAIGNLDVLRIPSGQMTITCD